MNWSDAAAGNRVVVVRPRAETTAVGMTGQINEVRAVSFMFPIVVNLDNPIYGRSNTTEYFALDEIELLPEAPR